MKKITLLIALLFAFITNAQENYPGEHPDLLVGKQVKVISSSSAEKYGYNNFYTDTTRQKIYLEDTQKRTTSYNQLLGKTFTVVSAGPVASHTSRVELKSETGETVYYYLTTNLTYGYPFEVIGGLKIPAEYYCEGIEQSKFENTTNYKASPAVGIKLNKEITPGKPDEYYMSFSIFLNHDVKPQMSGTLLLDNRKTIVFNCSIIPEFVDGTTFKYRFVALTSEKEIELLKSNKLIGVLIGDKVAPINDGERIKNVLNCLVTKK